MTALIYLHTNTVQGIHFLHILTTFVICVFDDRYSDRCELISHYSLDFHFPKTSDVQIFSCACWPFYIFFGEVFSLVLCPLFWIRLLIFLLLSYRSSSSILDSNPLSDVIVYKYFLILWAVFSLS